MYRIDFVTPYWEYSKKYVTVEDARKIMDKVKNTIAKDMELPEDEIEISDYLVYEDKRGYKYFDCVMQISSYRKIGIHYYYDER